MRKLSTAWVEFCRPLKCGNSNQKIRQSEGWCVLSKIYDITTVKSLHSIICCWFFVCLWAGWGGGGGGIWKTNERLENSSNYNYGGSCNPPPPPPPRASAVPWLLLCSNRSAGPCLLVPPLNSNRGVVPWLLLCRNRSALPWLPASCNPQNQQHNGGSFRTVNLHPCVEAITGSKTMTVLLHKQWRYIRMLMLKVSPSAFIKLCCSCY